MNLPTTWKEISLETYCQLDKIIRSNELRSNEKDIEILSLLSGRPRPEILALSFSEISRLKKKIAFLDNMDSIKLLKPGKATFKFFLKGKLYRVSLQAAELSGGQYIDLMSFLKDTNATIQNIHNILAVIALPIKFGFVKTGYSGKHHADRAQLFFRNLPVSIAYPLLIFFCNLSANLTAGIQDYLKTTAPKKMHSILTEMNATALAGS